ncbi:MAG: YvcK family protein [Tissierellia bacterium]|nr:YvcK family protein [Tissierellia bacterium]
MVKNIKITTIGGGTGSSSILKGIKYYTQSISAIVTVADDGGSSGRLRKDFGILPPGDIRSCIYALSNAPVSLENALNYRFDKGDLKGHSLGNLILTAFTDMFNGFDKALSEMSSIFNITGKIYPMTLEDVKLYAILEDDSIIEGESNITFLSRLNDLKIKSVYLNPNKVSSPIGAKEAILEADYILVGPGSLFTSIMPNFLVDDIKNAFKNSNAKKIYISNIMTQPGETDNFNLRDHINAIDRHLGTTHSFDYIFVNNKKIPENLYYKYLYKNDSKQIFLSKEDIYFFNDYDIKIIMGDFLDESQEYVRHDGKKIVKKILGENI